MKKDSFDSARCSNKMVEKRLESCEKVISPDIKPELEILEDLKSSIAVLSMDTADSAVEVNRLPTPKKTERTPEKKTGNPVMPVTPERSKSALVVTPNNYWTKRSNGSSRSCKTSVIFTEVQVRRYDIVAGDNPSVTMGPPLSIGWEFESESSFNIDEFEECRGVRRSSAEMVMPRAVREELLLANGFTKKEIMEVVKEVARCKNNRQLTVENMKFEPVELKIENCKRSLKRALSFPTKKTRTQPLMGSPSSGKKKLTRSLSSPSILIRKSKKEKECDESEQRAGSLNLGPRPTNELDASHQCPRRRL